MNDKSTTPTCPKCGQEMYCGCAACRRQHQQKTVWRFGDDGYTISCGACGFKASELWWAEREMKGVKDEL